LAKVKVVTDSTADIPRSLVEELDITVVPLNVHFGDKTYLDYVELTSSNFYDMLRTNPEHPRTSQPSPGDVAAIYEKLIRDGSPIASIHVSSGMSGTFQSAVLAKDLVKSGRIEVVDSRMASMGLGLSVVEAARAAQGGMGIDEVIGQAKRTMAKTKVFFAVDTLEYLARNGRIGKAQALLGNLLSLKPILTLDDGIVSAYEKVRGDKKVFPRMVEIMGEMLEAGRPPARCAIVHADCPDRAEALKAAVESAYSPTEIIVGGLGAVVGTHVGPGTMALIWYQP
jgi:DegV family protein with EDD domain